MLPGGRSEAWGRLRVSVVMVASLVVVLAGCGLPGKPASVAAERPAATPTPPPRGLVVIGDSLTVGLYATTIDHTYASLLAARWGTALTDRVGIAGVHADGLLDAVDRMHANARDVVVEVGTNDFGKAVEGDFVEAYRALITAISAREPRARIICLGLWRSAQERTPWGHGPEAYDALISTVCPGPFVSLQALTGDPTNRGPANQLTFSGRSDSFHPNDRGHEAIAGAIADAVAD